MKWSDVQIIDENDKVYTGFEALRYVEDKCKPFANNIRDGLIEVNTYSPTASTEDKDVRLVLLTKLKGKAKSVRFFKGESFQRPIVPVARAVKNILNVNRAKLRVEIIFKQDPRDPGPRKFLEDSVVPVTATYVDSSGLLTSTIAITQDTIKGVVDFGVVDAGKYKITPDYSKLEACKYDWTNETREVLLEPLSDKIVEFQVEPLYQKVQLIAQCMLAIPDNFYVFSESDLKKVKIEKDFSWEKLSFNEKPNSERLYTAKACGEQTEATIADIEGEPEFCLVTMKVKDTSRYYKLSEVEPLLDPTKVKVKEEFKNSSIQHLVEFKEKYAKDPIYPLALKLKKDKKTPYTSEDIKQYLGSDEVVNIEPVVDSGPPVYKVKFKKGSGPGDLKKKPAIEIAEFGDKIAPPSINAYPLQLQKKKDSESYYEFNDISDYVYSDKIVRSVDPVDEKDLTRYRVEFKEDKHKPEDLEKPLPPEIGVFGEREMPPDENAYLLTSKLKDDKKKIYYALKDIRPELDFDLIESIESNSAIGSYKYNVEFKPGLKPEDLKNPVPSDVGEFGKKELFGPGDVGLEKDKGELIAKSSANAYTADTLELMIKEGDQYWQLKELDAYLKNDNVLSISHEESEPNPNKFIIKFKEGCTDANLEPPLPEEVGKFGKKNMYPDLLVLGKVKVEPEYYAWTDLDIAKLSEVIDTTNLSVNKERFWEIKYQSGKARKDLNALKLDAKIVKVQTMPTLRLQLQPKPPVPVYYELKELKDTLLQKIETPKETDKESDNPPVYKVKFKSGSEQYTLDDLEGKWMARYHGLEHDKDDIAERVKLVEATLKLAFDQAEKDPTILKLFMLPECYFQGRYGAYLVGDPDLKDEDQLLFKLVNLVGDVKWRDWVFVFGTVNFTFGEKIREMMNYSPVVRGGLGPAGKIIGGGGQDDKQLRLVQKLINSAELIDQSQLLHHLKDDTKDKDSKEETFYEVRPGSDTPVRKATDTKEENYKEDRTPSVNDAVQFQASQNEEEASRILRQLLDKGLYFEDLKTKDFEDKDFGVAKGLTSDQWTELKAELVKNVDTLGLTRVIRAIRVCKIEDTLDDLSKWGPYSGYDNRGDANREPLAKVGVTSEWLMLRFIREAWERIPHDQPKVPEFTTPNPVKGKAMLEDLKKNRNEYFQKFGITLQSHKDDLNQEIEKLDAEAKLIDLVKLKVKELPLPSSFAASIYPIWKKILELYMRTHPGVMSFDAKQMNFRDYCFAGLRKAGPWEPLAKVEKLDPCKKLVFGLEICADHGSGQRLKMALSERKPYEMIPEKVEKERKILILPTNDQFTNEEREKKNEEIEKENLEIDKENEKIKKENEVIRARNAQRQLENNKIPAENAARAKVKIDIHLVPSAGFCPTETSIAARLDGYCFNCDGWNKGGKLGVNYIRKNFDGPLDAKFATVHPVTPHTAIAKGGDNVKRNIPSFKPKRIDLSAESDFKVIDNSILNRAGLGELHVYNPLELPKNPPPTQDAEPEDEKQTGPTQDPLKNDGEVK